MKSFLETYGIAIFTLVVIAILIAFAGPFGLRIKQYMLDKANYTHQIGTEEIDKATNGDMQKKIDPTDIYAMLYADGELVLSSRPITPEKEVYGNGAGDYGKVENQNAVPWNPSPIMNKQLNIQKVRVLDTIAPTTCKSWFMNCEKLQEISNFEKLNVANCSLFDFMFFGCKSLLNVNALQNWNVSNVNSFQYIFNNCTSLVNIDALSNWNVSNGTDFQSMFSNCTSLVNINALSNWNVLNGNNFQNMFDNCTSLININGLSNWNVLNGNNFQHMFRNCTSLVNINGLSNWNVSNSTYFQDMFSNCTSLVNINGLSNWDVSNGTYFNNMFYNCTHLTNVDALQNWNVSNGTIFQRMFSNCTSLTDTSPLVSWLTNGNGMKSDEDTSDMFFNVPGGNPFNSVYACLYDDGELVISSKPIEKTKTVKQDYGFVEIPTHPWIGSSVKTVNFLTKVKPQDVRGFFDGCSQLSKINNIENLDTSNVTNMYCMFRGCRSLTSLDLSNFDTHNVTNMSQMFQTCPKLSTLKLGDNFDVSKVSNISSMFRWCGSDASPQYTEIIGASDTTKTKLNVDATYAPTYIRAWN